MEKLDKLFYDTIVVGGTLEALIHSYVDGIPLILVNPQIPFYLDVDPLGSNKAKIWNKLSFYLSYAGLSPISDKAGNYRFDEGNILTVFGKTAYKIEIKYNNIIRYDQIQATEKLRVFDFIKLQNIQTSDIETINKIKTNEDFIDYFYTMINDKVSEAVAVSLLTQKELESEDYGIVYARIKAEEALKNHGVIGRVEPLKNGTSRTHKIKTSIIKRQAIYDTREQEDKILVERRETKSSIMKNVIKTLGSPYAV